MSTNDKKRYYWLKLDKDFFKSHEIKIVESMPNGKDYILFYLKLLCESTSHEGTLRFSDAIPYNEDMLSTITSTNIDIVRSAIKLFSQLNMMEIWDDGTLYFNQMSKMIGSETGVAKRVREYRENVKVTNLLQCNQEIDIEKDIDIEIDNKKEIIKEKKSRFVKPKLEQIKEYCNERNNKVDYQKFYDYYESNGWKVGRNSMKDWKATIRTWERNTNGNEKNEQESLFDKLDQKKSYGKDSDYVDLDGDYNF